VSEIGKGSGSFVCVRISRTFKSNPSRQVNAKLIGSKTKGSDWIAQQSRMVCFFTRSKKGDHTTHPVNKGRWTAREAINRRDQKKQGCDSTNHLLAIETVYELNIVESAPPRVRTSHPRPNQYFITILFGSNPNLNPTMRHVLSFLALSTFFCTGVALTVPHHSSTAFRPILTTSSSPSASYLRLSATKEDTQTQNLLRKSTIAAATIATTAVNAAVSMKALDAPNLDKSYISLDTKTLEVDETGLPAVYNRELIQQYWSKQRGALNERWGEFLKLSVPFLTRITTLFITDRDNMNKYAGELSKSGRVILEELGPTFIKLGQMMSVRPDVLPEEALIELAILQDSVSPFPTTVAVEVIEKELGGKLGEFFAEISEEPVAAASLAQVYKAVTLDGQTVAVKVQRPDVLTQVSKDLYVLRRAAEVYQGLMERFAPQQRTDYVALLNEFAIGFYTELDFVNEGKNQEKLRNLLIEENVKGVLVPRVYQELSTRRVLVSSWVDGLKLSSCSQQEIADLTVVAQEAFLVQLLRVGFFHSDPHSGNLLKLNDVGENGEVLAIIDCGLMASIQPEDRDMMISAVIHLANKDWASLVNDFIDLKILPADCDRSKVVPLMEKALAPYILGGGAKTYEKELRKTYKMDEADVGVVGGFQAMTQDALVVLNDIPFSIPAYFAILGRAIVTLEGVALTGNPNYSIIMESYPFIARQLIDPSRPVLQKALNEILYSGSGSGEGEQLKISRLMSLIGNAASASDAVEEDGSGGAGGVGVINLDAKKDIDMVDAVKIVFGQSGEALRGLLSKEAVDVSDLILRQVIRKAVFELEVAAPSVPNFLDPFNLLPKTAVEVHLPILLPGSKLVFTTLAKWADAVAPKLDRSEELYALSVVDAMEEFGGGDVARFVKGEKLLGIETIRSLNELVVKGDVLKVMDTGDTVGGLIEALGSVLGGILGGKKGVVGEGVDGLAEKLTEEERLGYDAFVEEVIRKVVRRAEERAIALVV